MSEEMLVKHCAPTLAGMKTGNMFTCEYESRDELCRDVRHWNLALFGSYGWGDGEWMRNWEDTCRADGAVFACDFVICNEAPDDSAVEECEALGAALA